MSRIDDLEPLRQGVESGIHWKILFGPNQSFVNGYVQVPDNHPFYGLDYEDIDVNIHGGLTYAEEGWIGFDTAHAFDIWTDEELSKYGGINTHEPFIEDKNPHVVIWTFDALEEETKKLARQVDAKDNN